MSKENLTLGGVVWWPHSGGRWLCRSILKKHSLVHETAFTHPWLFYSTDMTLDLDITAQVHKARSLPELRLHLNALKASTDFGRQQGLRKYFDMVRETYQEYEGDFTHIIGEMCLGSPIPRHIDLESLFAAYPDFKLVHLVRSPLQSFQSFAIRHELDSDPVRIAGSWLALNAHIRHFFHLNPQFAGNIHLVKYEDLLEDPKTHVAKICEFLGLEFEDEMVAHLEERWGRSTKPKTPDSYLDIMRQVARSELDVYGYE